MPTDRVMRNAFTVDVEDYFQVSAFEPHIARENWSALPSRVERNTEMILELLAERGVHGTFFVLGWIAERYPKLLRRIAASGHELASHGYNHIRASVQQPEEFRSDVAKAKHLIEDAAGAAVIGYRAPSFSINAANLWALDILKDTGHEYSSSIYPIRHDHYGMPGAPRFAFRYRRDGILEVPISTIEVGGRRLPAGGGGFFRLFPYALTRWVLRRLNEQDRRPGVFYFHPWEIDAEQPRPAGVHWKSSFRHYLNLDRTRSRLKRLLGDFQWGRMDEIFMKEKDSAPCLDPRN
jgi:polysaccharide deacetylase family protein (PEP-CTERM system associated)